MRRLPFLFLSLSFGLALISAIPVAPPTNIAEEAAARSPPPLPLPTINQDFGIGIKAFFRRVRAKFFRTKTSDRIISTFATPSTSSLDPMSSFSSTAAYAGGSSDRWRSLSIPDETAILPFRRPSVRAPLPPLPPIIDDGQKRDLPKLWNARKSFDASSGSSSGSTSHRRKVSLEFASASSSPRRPARPLSPKPERRGKELERSPKIKSVRIIEDAPRRGSVASMRSFTFPIASVDKEEESGGAVWVESMRRDNKIKISNDDAKSGAGKGGESYRFERDPVGSKPGFGSP